MIPMSYNPEYPYCKDCGEDVHRTALKDANGVVVRDTDGHVVFRKLPCPMDEEWLDA